MMGLLADHLWQSTLFAAAAALLTLAFRKNRAHVRYWIWLAASMKFLIPFAGLVAIGSQFGWRTTMAQVQDFQIVGGPAWMNTDRFDIAAKAEGNPPQNEVRLMLQRLLVDRFKLSVRNETRECWIARA